MPQGAGAAAALRAAIVEALYDISAYELEDVCTGLGLRPPDEGEAAFNSKRTYIKRRLVGLSEPELRVLAERVYDDYAAHDDLKAALGRTGAVGVDGQLKNLIFASVGPKPRIVLRDALNNILEVVENEDSCLVYDRPIPRTGLTWAELVDWWAAREGLDPSDEATRRSLYNRLRAALSPDSPAEGVVFEAYRHFYHRDYRGENPALIPQVYLHYDPYSKRELAQFSRVGEVLKRQRMDFLLLLSDQTRIVIEVDGKQHYSVGDQASPERYAEMAAEDRALRLAGYEMYRFGAAELLAHDGPRAARVFFDELLARYDD